MKQNVKIHSPAMKRPREGAPLGQSGNLRKNIDVSMTPDTFERSQSRIKKKAVKRRSLNDTYINNNRNKGNYTQLDMTQDDDSMMDVDCDETPATLSQISAINPMDNDTLTTTFAPKRKHRKSAADETWEMAVEYARGEPDGAERSFTRKALSKISLDDSDNDEDGDSPEEEGFSEDESATPPKKAKLNQSDKKKSPKLKENKKTDKSPKLEKKKSSAKLQLKQAAKTLKSLKNPVKKEKKDEEKDFDALPDETQVPTTPSQKRKEKKMKRKMVKNNFDLITTAKRSWEILRRADTDTAKRKAICDDLMTLVVGKVKELSVVHDSSRVVQCLVQFGNEEQRVAIFEEIKNQVPDLLKSKYAKFIVRKLIHYGSKDLKAQVFQCFRGNVQRLIKHKEASEIIEYAFNEYASSSQRMALLEEFYGPLFAFYKDADHRTLDQIMTQMPEKKDVILRNMKDILLSLINKELLVHSIVHKVLIDFFTYADDKSKKELIEGLKDHIPHLLHTRDGTRAAMHCVWSGTIKDRKAIIKSLKTFMLKICKEEQGHVFLFSIFDNVDDTVIVQKIMLSELVKSLDEVMTDSHGRRVLQYLLAPRDTSHCHPDIVKVLQKGDGNPYSKKDSDLRAKELRTYISPHILKYLEQNVAEMMLDSNMVLFVKTVMTNAVGDARPAMIAIADFVAKPKSDGDLGVVEHPACHIAMKKIIANDKVRMEAGEGILFSSILLEALPKSTIKIWAASNRGCFMLLSLLEVGCPTITERVTAELQSVRNSLNKMTFKGAELLLAKLKNPASKKPKEFRV